MKRKTNKKQQKTLIILISIVLFLSITFFSLKIYTEKNILNIQQINYTINITDYVGFNLDTDKLHFGGIIPGGHSQRTMSVISEIEGYVFILTNKETYLYVNEQGQEVEKDKPAILTFKAVIPKDKTHQNIEETIQVYILKKEHAWPIMFYGKKIMKTFEEYSATPSIMLNISDKN
jgi:hypothetical protein